MKKYFAPILSVVLALINAAATAVYIKNGIEADVVPTHFQLDMTPDRFGSKWLLMIDAVFPLLIAVLFLVYRIVTRSKENHRKNMKYENVFIVITVIFMAGLMWFINLTASGAITPKRTWLPYLGIVLGVMFTLFGNISGKIKQQRNFGIKTAATLKNKTVWLKTHRLSGIFCVITGIFMVLCSIAAIILKKYEMPLFVAGIAAMMILSFIVPTIYAEILYKKLGSDEEEE